MQEKVEKTAPPAPNFFSSSIKKIKSYLSWFVFSSKFLREVFRTAPLYLSHSTSLVRVIGCTPESEKATSLTPHLTKPCRKRKKCPSPLSSLLWSVAEGQGTPWAAGEQLDGARGATRCTSSPFRTPQRGRALGTTRRNRDLFSTFKWYREPFEAKWGGYFFVVSFFILFFFSQGFPKWMAVKDFNILQAQQLILKSLAEGFYRGKLGCKSFWRLFPFWNL